MTGSYHNVETTDLYFKIIYGFKDTSQALQGNACRTSWVLAIFISVSDLKQESEQG